MKSFFLSLLLGGLYAGTAVAQFSAGEDSFASASVIPTDGGRSRLTDLSVCTLEVGEVLGVSTMLPKTAWWRWTASEDGFCVIETVASGVILGDNARPFSELAIFSGDSVTRLTKVAQGATYRANANSAKLGVGVRFYAQKGRTYSIQVGSTFLPENARNVVLMLAPLPTKPLVREAVWSYMNELGMQDVGAMSLMQNVSGAISGKVRLRSGTYPFTGMLDHLGMVTVGVTEKQKKGQLPQGPIIMSLTGFKDQFVSVAFPSGFIAGGFIYDNLPLDPISMGNWTGTMASVGHAPVGAVTMKVSASQSVSVALRFLDGTVGTHNGRFMSSAFGLNPSGFAMMKFLGGGKSAFQASGAFNSGPAFAFSGSGSYIRQEKPEISFYPAGISTVMNISIFPYSKPAIGQRALDFLNATDGVAVLRVTDPNNELDGNMDLPVTLGTNNKFVFVADTLRKPALKLNVTTGQVTGSVILDGKKRNIIGTLSNPTNPVMQGYITGTEENVRFEVLP